MYSFSINHDCGDAAIGTNGGHAVEVEGSFDNWTSRHPLQRSGKDFTLVKLLPPGVYQVCELGLDMLYLAKSVQRCSICISSQVL